MQSMSPNLKNLLMTTSFMIVSLGSLAQYAGTGDPPPPPNPDGRAGIPSLPGLVVPIDENILILLVLGLLVGIAYLFRNRFSKS